MAKIFGHAALVGGDHDHERVRIRAFQASQRGERGSKPADPEAEPGRRHLLSGKARDEIIIAPARGDRAELHRAAIGIGGCRQQLGLEDRAGIVAKTAHDGGIKHGKRFGHAKRGQDGIDLLKRLNACTRRRLACCSGQARSDFGAAAAGF